MQSLSHRVLKNGSPAEVLLVASPCPQATPELVELLGHKGEPWVWQIALCIDGRAEGINARFYVARVEGQLVANVTVLQTGGLGSLGHVFTKPEYRGQGLARTLLEAAVADFDRHGGRAMVLTTGFESMPWRLYSSVGFRGTCPEQGYGGMVRFAPGDDWQTVLSGPPGEIRQADWPHYMGLQVLFGAPGPVQLRSVLMPSIGPRVVEGGYLHLRKAQEEGRGPDCRVIEGPAGAVLGCAVLGNHPVWGARGARQVLDLYSAPAAAPALPNLVSAILEPVSGPVECWCDSRAKQQMEALQGAGFRVQAELGPTLRMGDQVTEVILMVRG